jgi:hypothetical protein
MTLKKILVIPVAVGLIVFTLLFLEMTAWLSFIPAVIVGAAVYIAFMCYISDTLFADSTFIKKHI